MTNRSGYQRFVRICAGWPEPAWDEDPDEECDTIDGEPVRGLGSHAQFRDDFEGWRKAREGVS